MERINESEFGEIPIKGLLRRLGNEKCDNIIVFVTLVYVE